MSDDVKTEPARGPESHAEATAAGSNGTATARPKRAAAAAETARAAAPVPAAKVSSAQAAEPCEDCPPAGGRDYSSALGWLMIGAAAALVFIGADLASRGAISRRLGAAGWEPEQ